MYYWQGEKYKRLELIDFLKLRQLGGIEKWERSLLEFAIEWLDEKNEFFKVKTSGSTGEPKLIHLTREQMINSAKATQRFLQLKKGDSCLLVLPAEFIAGKMMMVRALEIGMDVYYYPPQVSVFQHIKREFDFAAFIPLQIQFAIDSGIIENIHLIKKLIIGGASLADKYINHLQDLKSHIYATYGMTETITHVAMKNLKHKNAHFKALPGIEFSVDENSCLIIKSDRLPNKINHTNDIVELLSSTDFILKGRHDHIINSGGLKIIPEETEEHIQSILQKEVFIGYQKDKKLGQKLVMVLEENELNESEIIQKLSVSIDKKYLPKKILSISNFIRTENQKINRKKMQEWILKSDKK